jgi:TPP-dependent pyruvate/acetoin dehydrogenase alpha subunit
MGQTKRKTSSDLLDDLPIQSPTSRSVLHDIAVAIDPPQNGAIGIRELLDRLDFLAKADFFTPKEQSLDTNPSPSDPSPDWNIYDFADPKTFTEPLGITDWDGDELQLILRQMIRIRETSNTLVDIIKEGKTFAPPPLGIGSEALSTGLSRNITPQDQVFGTHHLPSHTQTVIDEFWDGIETTASRFSGNHKVNGSIVIAYIDAKNIEKSLAQEMMKLFQDRKYPVLFICERILPLQETESSPKLKECSTTQYADKFGIEWAVVDGNDVIAVADASAHLIDRIRKGRGVGFLEAVSFDHQTADKTSDPILRLKQAMIARGDINQAGFEILETLEMQMVNAAVTNSQAESST